MSETLTKVANDRTPIKKWESRGKVRAGKVLVLNLADSALENILR